MMHNTLADMISKINNAELSGKNSCEVRHVSKLAQNVLQIMKDAGYIRNFEIAEEGRGRTAAIQLAGRINSCKAIIPRFFVKKNEYELWEKRYLPAVGVGTLLVSTSQGLKNHREARGKIGGSILAYVY